jgi:hypothetical protein
MHRGKLIRCDTPERLTIATDADNLEGAFIQTIQAADALEAR